MMVQKYFWFLLTALALLAGACNRDKPAAEDTETIIITTPAQDTTVVDTLTKVAEDGVDITTPASGAVPELPLPQQEPAKQPLPQPSTPKQQQSQKKDPAPSQNRGADIPAGGASVGSSSKGILKEGTYRLLSVQGDKLPLVMDMTTECDTKLLKGELQLQNGKFKFASTVAEECGGQIRKQEEHNATGSYRLEGNRIFLNVETGEVLGNAVGLIEGTVIRLQQISNDVEQQEVDWVFQL